MFIYKLPFAKKHFKKKGYDPEELANKMWMNPKYGIGNAFITAFTGGLVLFFCLASHIYWNKISGSDFRVGYQYIIIAIIFNYFTLHHKNKYLRYFQEFNKKSKTWKIKWGWISFGTILGIILYIVGAFWLSNL